MCNKSMKSLVLQMVQVKVIVQLQRDHDKKNVLQRHLANKKDKYNIPLFLAFRNLKITLSSAKQDVNKLKLQNVIQLQKLSTL